MTGRYPSPAELDHIKNFKFGTWQDYRDFAEYIIGIWEFAEMGYSELRQTVFRLATAGWSGNESIDVAISQNRMFMAVCWESSHKGGLTIYHLPPKRFFKKKV